MGGCRLPRKLAALQHKLKDRSIAVHVWRITALEGGRVSLSMKQFSETPTSGASELSLHRADKEGRAGGTATPTRPILNAAAYAATRPAKTRASLVGSERVRRHPHCRTRSGPPSGVSCGPRACRVRVPIVSERPSPLFLRLVRPFRRRLRPGQARHDLLELAEDFAVVLFEIADETIILEESLDVAARHDQA